MGPSHAHFVCQNIEAWKPSSIVNKNNHFKTRLLLALGKGTKFLNSPNGLHGLGPWCTEVRGTIHPLPLYKEEKELQEWAVERAACWFHPHFLMDSS